MDSIFSKQEIANFHSLQKLKERQLGNIRGSDADWSIAGDVTCGRFSSINGSLKARGKVKIGSYCALGHYISLLSSNHRTDMPNQQVWLNQRFGFQLPVETKGPIEIGHNVWIGDKVNVLSGVQVGHGCVIAAGATVTKSVGPFEIVAGTPARVVRKRFSAAVIAQLLDISWWHWSDEKMAENKPFFEAEIPSDGDMDLVSLCV